MNNFKTNIKAYFTVETAIIYPFVLGVVLLLIYMWYFQYDRCLLDMDVGMITVMSSECQDLSPKERVAFANDSFSNLYKDEYVGWNWGKTAIAYNFGKLKVTSEGSVNFPFSGLNFWNGSETWNTRTERSGYVTSQMLIIRTYRKISGIFNKGD